MQSAAPSQLSKWLEEFEDILSGNDTGALDNMFGTECYWRDIVAFTWNIITLEGMPQISDMLGSSLQHIAPHGFVLESETSTADGPEGWFSFETKTARCKGHVRIKDGKCRTLTTMIIELKGFEEPVGKHRAEGVIHKPEKGRKSWTDLRREEERTFGITEQPYCLIIGGSQGGLALGARLKRIGVPTLIVDALPKPGDAWRSRYNSLYLHDPIWMDHLPYIPFPEHWPVYTAKDKMGDWLEMYCKVMELNFWGSTLCEKATYDDKTGIWNVQVNRDGKTVSLQPKHLVLATGLSGKKFIPEINGAKNFKGQQYHSADHPGGEGYADKNCVVVGANNSAHDICAELWEKDANVTMLQRSSATVVKASRLRALGGYNLHYQADMEGVRTIEEADLIASTTPFRLQTINAFENTKKIKEMDADFYVRLRDVGFQLDFGEDETGLSMKYMRRASGYYIDVGASELIIRKEINLKSGIEVEEIRAHSVLLNDGTELPADIIVYATGYGPMNQWAAELISQEVADKVGPVWGLGSGTTGDPGPWEGELKNMWKPTGQKALWFHGGNLQQSRFHSLHLALQIKARMEDIATPVYQPK